MDVDGRLFNVSPIEKWSKFYNDTLESIPINAPTPRGLPVKRSFNVNTDHAGYRVKRRSHTGISLYLPNTYIIWFSKCQSTVESSSFGLKFIALRIASEMIESLRYKLRIIVVHIEGSLMYLVIISQWSQTHL